MNIPSPRAQKRARIEIVPLIDIVFFLLATFVMVSMAMVKNKGIAVNLPVAATSAAQDRKEHHTITVTKDGELFFDKEPVRADQLPARLQRLKAEQTDPKVYINGDEKAHFGAAVGVLDELRRFGFTKVAIETKARP